MNKIIDLLGNRAEYYLGSVQPVGGVRLNWEASFGKGYKIQVSDDAETWKEVYKTEK